ncbi:MAG: protein translocase subunit SecF [Syntrophales bacterium]|jgi:preprotein translocase subunit SecF|nr:protein translocase subunit SecF [Syntrophales bacterium]
MELLKQNLHIDFVGKMKLAFVASVSMIVISILSVILHGGLNYGIDFAGGTLVQIKFKAETPTEKIRAAFRPIGLENSIIQQVGDQEYVVRMHESSSDTKGLSGKVEDALTAAIGKGAFEIRRVEVVGPKVGRDLTNKAIWALVFAWLGMLIYIAFRFEFRYAVGAILALVHDTMITVGALSLFNKEFTLIIVAALLTIVGYSINDTIVVFDRIRENVRKNPRQTLGELINISINQTLSRTILTSLTVLIVVVILFFLGGEVIHDFAFALIVGVLVGTYSSVFIAAQFILIWERFRPAKQRKR